MIFRNGKNSLIKELFALKKAGEMCDIVIKTEDSNIGAHKVVLCAGSPVFKAMLCGEFKESNQEVIKLQFLAGPAVSKVVDYLYTGLIMIQKNMDLDMLKDILQGWYFC